MRSPLFLAPVLLAGLLLPLASARGEDPKVGKIDMERVFKEYKLYAQLVEEFNNFANKLVNRAEQRAKRYGLLLDEEWNRLVELLEKGPNATPAEKDEIAKLEKVNNDRDQELANLDGKPQLTDDEKKRYGELVSKRTQARQGIDDYKNKVQQQIKDRDDELTAQIYAKIEAAVAKVAADKKLSMVVVSKYVLFGGIDVTDDVLKVLNTAPPAGDKPAPPPH
ncbi:MAG: OmpH family outer membrane protein [Armatimonadetes bacterium]|nr:OmpH family outer membrane protein [Armatimonadota bacterium]